MPLQQMQQICVTDHDACRDGQLIQCYKTTSQLLGCNLSIVQWYYHAEDAHTHTCQDSSTKYSPMYNKEGQ